MQLPLNKESWSQILVADRLFTSRPSWWNQTFYNIQGRFGTTWGKDLARIASCLIAKEYWE